MGDGQKMGFFAQNQGVLRMDVVSSRPDSSGTWGTSPTAYGTAANNAINGMDITLTNNLQAGEKQMALVALDHPSLAPVSSLGGILAVWQATGDPWNFTQG